MRLCRVWVCVRCAGSGVFYATGPVLFCHAMPCPPPPDRAEKQSWQLVSLLSRSDDEFASLVCRRLPDEYAVFKASTQKSVGTVGGLQRLPAHACMCTRSLPSTVGFPVQRRVPNLTNVSKAGTFAPTTRHAAGRVGAPVLRAGAAAGQPRRRRRPAPQHAQPAAVEQGGDG